MILEMSINESLQFAAPPSTLSQINSVPEERVAFNKLLLKFFQAGSLPVAAPPSTLSQINSVPEERVELSTSRL